MQRIHKAAAVFVTACLLAAAPVAANATQDSVTPPTECVPAEAWTEVVPDIEHEAVYGEAPLITPATEASTKWWNFSPNSKGQFEGEPSFPTDERGTWQGPHTEGGPGQDQTGVYQQGNGNGSWFYRENTPAQEAVYGERPLISEAYTEVVPDIEHPAVTCGEEEPEPEVVAPVACAPAGGWYTEGDDLAPVATEAGLVFAGGSGKAVGYRLPVTGNLQGWSALSFDATGGTEQFFFRIVINASADGGKAYQSLSFPGYTTIDSSSVSYQFGESIAATAARFPHAVITSIGFQTNSGAPAGFEAVLSSVSGGCIAADFTWAPLPEDTTVPGEWSTPVVTCDTEVGDEITVTREVVITTYTRGEGGAIVEHVETVTESDVIIVEDGMLEGLECPIVEPEPEEPAVVTPPAPAAPAPAAVTPVASSDTLAVTGGPDLRPLAFGGILAALVGATALTVVGIRRRSQQ